VNVPTETRKYVLGAQGLAYVASSLGTVNVFHTDRLGSVRAMSDVNAQVVEIYQTDEYGVPTDTEGTIRDSFQWTGEERDENGLVFLRARTYHPDTGRFLERDPLKPTRCSLADPLNLNRLAYIEDNPVNRVDPSGMGSFAGLTWQIVGTITFGGISIPIVQCEWNASRPTPKPRISAWCSRQCALERQACLGESPIGDKEAPWDDFGCWSGYYQCLSTAGWFENPGWRRKTPSGDEWRFVC
jgi:RHS repeat-associated protein